MLSEVPRVQSAIIHAFHDYLRENNAYVQGFLTMKEMLDEENRVARAENREIKELKLLFSLDERVDFRLKIKP
jgi:hypothetical protein